MTNETSTAAGEEIVPAAEAIGAGSSSVALIGAPADGWRPLWVTETRLSERGLVSAEWAVAIIAAIALAGVLLAVVTSAQVEKALLAFVTHVISTFGK